MFFDPHPGRVLAPARAPRLLTTAKRRQELLLGAGVDEAVAQPFDERFAAQPPESFVREILVGQLGARAVVVGPDFRFGNRRIGDLDLLRAEGQRYGFEVHVVEPFSLKDERVSSTRIRELLTEGHVKHAALLLGRFHDVAGTVIEGDQRGRTIGFPTANLDCEPVVLPEDGVYAVLARDLGKPAGPLLRGVANLGNRPTTEAGRSFEAHFFDFSSDIYGTTLRLAFVARIREEVRFTNLDALKARIALDVEEAHCALGEMNEEWAQWV